MGSKILPVTFSLHTDEKKLSEYSFHFEPRQGRHIYYDNIVISCDTEEERVYPYRELMAQSSARERGVTYNFGAQYLHKVRLFISEHIIYLIEQGGLGFFTVATELATEKLMVDARTTMEHTKNVLIQSVLDSMFRGYDAMPYLGKETPERTFLLEKNKVVFHVSNFEYTFRPAPAAEEKPNPALDK